MQHQRRGEPDLRFRLPKLAQLAVKDEAERIGISPSAYARALAIAGLTGRGKNSGVAHSALHMNFDRAVKRFMLTYQMVGPLITYHLPEKCRIALNLAARSRAMSFSRWIRKVAEEHLLGLYNSRNQLYNNHVFERFDRLLRQFILLCGQHVAIAAGAPTATNLST